ncbi:restriction endonuclease [Paraburkholderia sp. EG285A]|uniref:restriction endonuclease n=1 Tax=Paraburkholderia sp. EG285A TaxID=3237009 RepID=UPI0034D17398
MSQTPTDGDRLIQDVLAHLGWNADPVDVARRVRQLDLGLPAEDEFSVVCAWLGKCELLHKLDQQQVPVSSADKFQVPDLLAKFTTQTSKVPVLIEVKAKRTQTLSFRPDYLERLMNYSDLVGMPLLIAWKFHSVWFLFEAKHLRKANKNFNISLSTAGSQNLLGMLAGDVAYTIGKGAGMHLRFRKDKLISREETADGWSEQWQMTFDDLAFTDYFGERIADLDNGAQALFTAWDLEDSEEHTESHIYQHFVADSDAMQFAHHALVRLLNWESRDEDRPHWRALLRKEQVVANVANFEAALQSAFRNKIVSHVFHIRPHDIPDFLSSNP